MLTAILNLAAGGLKRRLGEQALGAAFAALPAVKPCPQTQPQSDRVRVAALQVVAKVYPSLAAAVGDMDSYMAQAVSQGAQLVCFPEMTGLLLLTLSPWIRLGLRFGAKSLQGSEGDEAAQQGDGGIQLPGLFAPFAFVAEAFVAVMQGLARRYGVYLSCGSHYALEGDKLFNRHVLLSPAGQVVGTQDKIHLVAQEAAMGLSGGESLCVVPTPLGNIALMVCMDATYFETFKVAKHLGADYAVVPIGDMAQFSESLALRGAQARVNEAGLAAVKPALVSGGQFPITFTGKAGVYFPMHSGLKSVECPAFDRRDMAVADMDLHALRQMAGEPFLRQNRAFNEAYFQALVGAKGRFPADLAQQ